MISTVSGDNPLVSSCCRISDRLEELVSCAGGEGPVVVLVISTTSSPDPEVPGFEDTSAWLWDTMLV